MLSYLAGLRACVIAALKVGDVINEKKDGTWEVKSEAVLKLRIPVNVNSHSCEHERHFFSTRHPDWFVTQVFTFNQLQPLFCA